MFKVTIKGDGSKVWATRSKVTMDAVRAGLLSAALRGQAVVVQETHAKKAVNTGALARSWRAIPTPRGAVLVNQQKYASVVENGRRPGKMVPIAPLTMWVLRKLGGSLKDEFKAEQKKYKNGARTLKRAGTTTVRSRTKADTRYDVAERVAWAISMSIKKKGIKGRFILHDTVPTLVRIAYVEVRRAIALANRKGGRP